MDLKSVIRSIDAARDEEVARKIRFAEAGATSIRLANRKRLPEPRQKSIMLTHALQKRSRLLPKG